jgi:tRNA 2-thiouridine synthesizing protein E
MEAKLDYVVERQEYVEDLVREMTPVVREAITAMAGEMTEWERRGLFAMGSELIGLFERLVDAYEPQDVRELGEHIVSIVDTVRNVTQPDVLDFANDATDVLHHAEDVEPVGPWGLARASADADVRRGMAVGLQILKHLGQVSGGVPTERRVPPPSSGAPAARPQKPTRAAEPAPKEVVEWQGRRFCIEGFLLDSSTWDPELANAMAKGLGVDLSDEHWAVLHWARNDYLEHGASPNVRRVARGSGAGTQRLYELFPGKPGKHIAMVAGIPKPVGCV